MLRQKAGTAVGRAHVATHVRGALEGASRNDQPPFPPFLCAATRPKWPSSRATTCAGLPARAASTSTVGDVVAFGRPAAGRPCWVAFVAAPKQTVLQTLDEKD